MELNLFGETIDIETLPGFDQSKENNLAEIITGPAISELTPKFGQRIRVYLLPVKIRYTRHIVKGERIEYIETACCNVWYNSKLIFHEYFVNPSGRINEFLLSQLGNELRFSATIKGQKLINLKRG